MLSAKIGLVLGLITFILLFLSVAQNNSLLGGIVAGLILGYLVYLAIRLIGWILTQLGIFTVSLINSAEGIRKAVKLSYKKITGTLSTPIPKELHEKAMFNALGTRYLVNGIKPQEIALWAELMPFLACEDQERALNALCEYIVYKEMPIHCNFDGLKREVNYFVSKMKKQGDEGIIQLLSLYDIPWSNLIEKKIAENKKELNEKKHLTKVPITHFPKGRWENKYYRVEIKNHLKILDKQEGVLEIPHDYSIEDTESKVQIIFNDNLLKTEVMIELTYISNDTIELTIFHGRNVHAKETLKLVSSKNNDYTI
jgi:hypothetical protein